MPDTTPLDDLFAALGLPARTQPGTSVALHTIQITQAMPDVALVRSASGLEGILPASEFFPDRQLKENDTYWAMLIGQTPRPVFSVVRPELVESAYLAVVPELRAGTVRVMSVARAAGVRTKVAVATTVEGLDPVAALIGRDANRIGFVRARIGGERLDIVAWHADLATFVRNALAPAAIDEVQVSAKEVVAFAASHQMSAAVGGAGLNSQLVSQLVGTPVTIRTIGSSPAPRKTTSHPSTRTAKPRRRDDTVADAVAVAPADPSPQVQPAGEGHTDAPDAANPG